MPEARFNPNVTPEQYREAGLKASPRHRNRTKEEVKQKIIFQCHARIPESWRKRFEDTSLGGDTEIISNLARDCFISEKTGNADLLEIGKTYKITYEEVQGD